MSPLLLIGGLGLGAYLLLRDRTPSCPVRNPELDDWSNSFNPPLGTLKLNIHGVPPVQNMLESMLSDADVTSTIDGLFAALPGNLVVINLEDEFYVYSADGIPRLSQNLKASYRRSVRTG